METAILLYTVLFVLYSILEVTGTLPQELRSSGLTLGSVFSRYYGDEVCRYKHVLLLCNNTRYTNSSIHCGTAIESN